MTQRKLPAYFKEYLDVEFGYLRKEAEQTNDHLKTLNGTVSKLQTIQTEQTRTINENNKKHAAQKQWNTRAIQFIGGMLIIGSGIWIKESRDVFIQIIKLVFGI